MSQFIERYREYRRFGLTPLIAVRLAWLVSTAGRRPTTAKLALRRQS